MADSYKPLKSGYAPEPTQLPVFKQKYQIKYGYYVLSGLIFVVTLVGLYIIYDLQESGLYFYDIVIDRTIATWYLAGLAVVFIGMRLRASFCVVCSGFRWPTRLDFNDYCGHCGASLFKYDVFEQQREEKSKHELTVPERFHEMVSRNNADAVRMLLYKGANVNCQDRFGNTPLMNAAMRGSSEMVDLLLQYRADASVTNNFGLNALMIAVDKRKLEIAKKLLESGVPTQTLDKEGRSAMEIAEAKKDEDMKNLLSQYS